MIDVVRSAIESAAANRPWAAAMSFAAGLATSFGPCIAPRFVAVTGMTANASPVRRWSLIAAFVVGLCASYVVLGSIAGALGFMAAYSSYAYAFVAVALVWGGVRTIVKTAASTSCGSTHNHPLPQSASFLSGFVMAGVASPCCGPVSAAIAGMSVASGSATFGAVLLGSYALGHSVPILAVALGAARLEKVFQSPPATTAIATVSGALMMALGGYYGLLA